MTDIDQTNIYSYKGTDYCNDLMDYLTARGIAVRTVKLIDGVIYITDETTLCSVPQGATWVSIAKHVGEGRID